MRTLLVASSAGTQTYLLRNIVLQTSEASQVNQMSRCRYAMPIYLYTERKKKRRVNFIPKFHSSLKKFVKYFTMITKRYMYGTKVPNFIGL